MNSTVIISGIQQVGIGVADIEAAWKWYRQNLGFDIKIFDDTDTATLMSAYTGGVPQKRRAVLAINLQGGGGLEIWQYRDRKPPPPASPLKIGDLGINIIKIRCRDIYSTYEILKEKKLQVSEKIITDPVDDPYFFLTDPFGNILQLILDDYVFKNEKKMTGGCNGIMVGVSDIEKSRRLYGDILGYDEIIYDEEDVFSDFASLPGGQQKIRRVLLKHFDPRKGNLCRLLGPTQIELVQVLDRRPLKIYENRYWGDLGFIHICFDIIGMKDLKNKCQNMGFPFVVDSSDTFQMEEAGGHFSYIEDPDGTLIEFVETHRLPILKKLGWYINLKKRKQETPLPDWIVKLFSLKRHRD